MIKIIKVETPDNISRRIFDMKQKNMLITLINYIYRIFLVFSALVLLAIVLIVSAQIFARQVLHMSIRWSQEVAILLMVWMGFITTAVGVERDLHIGIEAIHDRMPSWLQNILFYVNWVITICIGIIFMLYGTKQTMSTMSSVLPATKWPKSVMYIIIPISGFFIIYFSVIKILKRDDLLPGPLSFEKKEKTDG